MGPARFGGAAAAAVRRVSGLACSSGGSCGPNGTVVATAVATGALLCCGCGCACCPLMNARSMEACPLNPRHARTTVTGARTLVTGRRAVSDRFNDETARWDGHSNRNIDPRTDTHERTATARPGPVPQLSAQPHGAQQRRNRRLSTLNGHWRNGQSRVPLYRVFEHRDPRRFDFCFPHFASLVRHRSCRPRAKKQLRC